MSCTSSNPPAAGRSAEEPSADFFLLLLNFCFFFGRGVGAVGRVTRVGLHCALSCVHVGGNLRFEDGCLKMRGVRRQAGGRGAGHWVQPTIASLVALLVPVWWKEIEKSRYRVAYNKDAKL